MQDQARFRLYFGRNSPEPMVILVCLDSALVLRRGKWQQLEVPLPRAKSFSFYSSSLSKEL